MYDSHHARGEVEVVRPRGSLDQAFDYLQEALEWYFSQMELPELPGAPDFGAVDGNLPKS